VSTSTSGSTPDAAPLDPAHLEQASLGAVLDAVAAKQPVPGGGAVAGLVHAIGAALGTMVVAYSEGRKSLAEHADQLAAARSALAGHRTRAMELAAEDARAYGAMNALWRLPEDDPARVAGMPDAVAAAIAAPRATAELGLELLDVLEGLVGRSNPHLGSDLAIAAILAEAAVRAAGWNVRINLPMLPDEASRAEALGFLESSLKQATDTGRRIELAVAGA
jgi:formiminotetrahydrofolate cyclodeaminase